MSDTKRSRAGGLVNLDDRIREYTERIGDREPYKRPSKEQRERIAEGVGALLDGDLKAAEERLGSVGLGVARLTDATSGRRYHEVAATEDGTEARWGRLYVPADAPVRWSAQVPHPVADRGTEDLGTRLMEGTPGGALVLAGAHRTAGKGDAADVAHRTDSAFHVIVDQLQKRKIPGVQLHGFARAKDRPYDAILSTGATQAASTDARTLADLMEDGGARVCRGWSDRCPLEGTTNVQGKAAQQDGAAFIHVELAPDNRAETAEAQDTTAALTRLVTTWSERGRQG
ncbi:hypothetical protein ACIQCR_19595 [Streptomyces sp. NPDC093249]|uniref:hypothetical protein n=1 Tax=unclassified Streptomyces TaxID=2593676 RepID=UPI00344C31BF